MSEEVQDCRLCDSGKCEDGCRPNWCNRGFPAARARVMAAIDCCPHGYDMDECEAGRGCGNRKCPTWCHER